MKALGFLAVEPTSVSVDANGPKFVVQQIWPERKVISLSAKISESLSAGEEWLPTVGQSMADLTRFLADHTVSYDVDSAFERAKNLVLHNRPAPAVANYEWCPLFDATTPMELQADVETTPRNWHGLIPEAQLSQIHVIANECYVRGLGVKRDGKNHRIVVMTAPLIFDKLPSEDIVKAPDGWFVSIAATPQPPARLLSAPPAPQSSLAATSAGQELSEFTAFVDFVGSEGLSFNVDDLVLLYCSLSARQFVVLGGSGGIGKSSLALAVAKFFGCAPPGERMAWLTVEPSWVSSEQLVGHYDASARLFRASVNGLADVLIHAHSHSDIPHIVCLDELNLARVEHYLAPWLSLQEHADDGLTWKFYSPHQASECLNGTAYPPSVTVGPNVLWLGTVNLDEASYGLTDKFLDRITYIALRRSPFKEETDSRQTGDPVIPRNLLIPPAPVGLNPDQLTYFDDLNAITSIPLLGWRTLKAMRMNVGAVPRVSGQPVWNELKAWDEIFAARVLSKFRGSGIDWETWRGKTGVLKDRLAASPWGRLDRSLTVLDEITELKEWDHGL